jgi:hypothetical protein
MHKRAGSVHKKEGISVVEPGELTIEAPCSFIEGKNVPEGWRTLFKGKP